MAFVSRKQVEKHSLVRVYHKKEIQGEAVKWMKVHCLGDVSSRTSTSKLFSLPSDAAMFKLAFSEHVTSVVEHQKS